MALSVGHSCYCCERPAVKMDIDAALNELGMLSTITDSRKEYLRERHRTRSESSLQSLVKPGAGNGITSGRYQIIKIDRTYVTGFSDIVSDPGLSGFSQSSETSTDLNNGNPAFGSEYPTSDSVDLEEEADKRRSERRKSCPRKSDISHRNKRLLEKKMERAHKPYQIPMRKYHSFQEESSHTGASCSEENVHVPKSKTAQSKSNSSSPVKSSNPATFPRSRSLDNLDISFLSISGEHPDERREIDKMSQELRNLNVSDS